MYPGSHILKLLLSLGLNYIRWSQLVPMLLMWGFALLMLLALTFVNFQDQSMPAADSFLQWLMQLPLVGGRITQLLTDESSSISMADLKSFALSAWSVMTLVFMLVSMTASYLIGPFRPWTLKSKLLLAGLGVMLILAGLVFNYYANTQNFNGSASGWMFHFSLISLVVFLVSAYSLGVSHFLRFLNDALLATP